MGERISITPHTRITSDPKLAEILTRVGVKHVLIPKEQIEINDKSLEEVISDHPDITITTNLLVANLLTESGYLNKLVTKDDLTALTKLQPTNNSSEE